MVDIQGSFKGAFWVVYCQYVKDAFKDHVRRYERLGTYTSPEKEKVDILVVHLTDASKLERARTAIRNFVAGAKAWARLYPARDRPLHVPGGIRFGFCPENCDNTGVFSKERMINPFPRAPGIDPDIRMWRE